MRTFETYAVFDEERYMISCMITTRMNAKDLKAKGLIEPEAVLIRSKQYKNLLEACIDHNMLMGYEPYSPMLEEDGTICAFYFEGLFEED